MKFISVNTYTYYYYSLVQIKQLEHSKKNNYNIRKAYVYKDILMSIKYCSFRKRNS